MKRPSKTPVVRDQVLQAQAIARIVKAVNCVIEPEELLQGKAFGPGTRVLVKEAFDDGSAYLVVETLIDSPGTEYETSGLPWPGAELIF